MKDKKEKILVWIQFLIIIFLSLFLGILIGILISQINNYKNRSDINIQNIEENKIPVLIFEKIENGILFGEIKNQESRIIIKNETNIINGKFNFSVEEILPNLKTLPAPQNTKFVASKRGKYFYPLDSPRAFLIAIKNRIFFKTKEEANKNGYILFEEK